MGENQTEEKQQTICALHKSINETEQIGEESNTTVLGRTTEPYSKTSVTKIDEVWLTPDNDLLKD